MLHDIVQQQISLITESLPKYRPIEYDVDKITDAIMKKVTPVIDALIKDLEAGLARNKPPLKGLMGHLKDWWREFIGLQNEATLNFYQVLEESRRSYQNTPRTARNIQNFLTRFRIVLMAALRSATKANLEKALKKQDEINKKNQQHFDNLLQKRGVSRGSDKMEPSPLGTTQTSTLDFQKAKGYPNYEPISSPDSPEPTKPELNDPYDVWHEPEYEPDSFGDDDYDAQLPEDPEDESEPKKQETPKNPPESPQNPPEPPQVPEAPKPPETHITPPEPPKATEVTPSSETPSNPEPPKTPILPTKPKRPMTSPLGSKLKKLGDVRGNTAPKQPEPTKEPEPDMTVDELKDFFRSLRL